MGRHGEAVGPAWRTHQAYFGENDYQQYLLIRDMWAAFFMNVAIIGEGEEAVRLIDDVRQTSENT